MTRIGRIFTDTESVCVRIIRVIRVLLPFPSPVMYDSYVVQLLLQNTIKSRDAAQFAWSPPTLRGAPSSQGFGFDGLSAARLEEGFAPVLAHIQHTVEPQTNFRIRLQKLR